MSTHKNGLKKKYFVGKWLIGQRKVIKRKGYSLINKEKKKEEFIGHDGSHSN